MKIFLMTTIWKRPELTWYTFSRFAKQKEKLAAHGHELILCAIGSEGDISRGIAEKSGFIYKECPNFPLNRKNNIGCQTAKEHSPDCMIYVNSDSVFSDSYFETIVQKIEPMSVVGIRDLYNYNLQKKIIGYWNGWDRRSARYEEPIGTGRCYPKDVLEACNYTLWNPEKEIMRGLDYDCRMRLSSFGVSFLSYWMNDLNSFGVEVKTGENIWKWESLRHAKVFFGPLMVRILERVGALDLFDLANQLYPRSSYGRN